MLCEKGSAKLLRNNNSTKSLISDEYALRAPNTLLLSQLGSVVEKPYKRVKKPNLCISFAIMMKLILIIRSLLSLICDNTYLFKVCYDHCSYCYVLRFGYIK